MTIQPATKQPIIPSTSGFPVTEFYTRCGTKSCHCAKPGDKGHGPYYRQHLGNAPPASTIISTATQMASDLIASIESNAKAKMDQYKTAEYYDCYSEVFVERVLDTSSFLFSWAADLLEREGPNHATDVINILANALVVIEDEQEKAWSSYKVRTT